MKILVASDIHGSAHYMREIAARVESEGADLLVLLGDVFNHGPRNPFPTDYAPMQVADILNGMKERLVVIQGNCDSAVDQMVAEFHFVESALLLVGQKLVYCTHGHVFDKDHLPQLAQGDVLLYGHYHTVLCQEVDGVLCMNPGSVSLPKDENRAYILLSEDGAQIKTLEGEIIHKISW